MLSSSISCISCYLKASCFRPKPLQKHQQPEHEIKKRGPRKLQFWTFQTLPKSYPDPSQTHENGPKIQPRSLQDPFWRAFPIQPPKKDAKKWPKRGQDPPNPFQNPPKTLSKPSQNRWKNAREKYIVFGSLFFKIFSNFGLQNHRFFIDFLMHASIQISLIFGTPSPYQSISFGRMFDTL